jgi:hypothetical protein
MKTNQVNKVVVDKTLLLRRVIIISWITLALCFVVKIFGGNFFEIMCNNPNYIALCEYADTHFWLKYVIAIISSMFCHSFYILSILQKYKMSLKDFLFTFVSILISCWLKLQNQTIGGIFDIWIAFGLPFVLLGKDFCKKWWQVPIAYGLTFLFQLFSLLVKNIGIRNISETYFIGLIYMIDVYTMCVLYYLYRNFKKEKEKMGALWMIFAGKPVDKLKAMKAKREAEIRKLEAEITAIEIEISKRKNEN